MARESGIVPFRADEGAAGLSEASGSARHRCAGGAGPGMAPDLLDSERIEEAM